ncbi:four helix bundle protein [Poritiphilus flavus]|uniref:four helix bundle protein n=1 Tax=Poritiphilus flavus TaxID=2697053 RepID=UPI001EEB83B8|nr:four helix bundle protein [Poritiphilus flavus]
MIEEKSFQFSLEIIALVKELRKKKEYVFADQLLKSATSIGANVCEAGASQSKKDFISKMSIASKEARETRYWLRLILEAEIITSDMEKPLEEIEQIIRILTKIVKTSQFNLKSKT